MGGPFKMKGSPFQRNFGIGSPLHDHEVDDAGNTIQHEESENKESYHEAAIRESKDYEQTKRGVAAASGGDKAEILSNKYGGEWTKIGGQWKNAEGHTVSQAANIKANKNATIVAGRKVQRG